MIAVTDASARGAIVALLLVALAAGFVYFVGRLAGRPDWGGAGATLIAIVGAIFVLLDYL